MSFLYHHVPRNMQGDTLFPLNELKITMPEVYQKEVAKYKGREHVTQKRIALLNNCLWNDVLFLISTNPEEIIEARREAGWPDNGPHKYFKIDPSTLDQSKLAVFLFRPGLGNTDSYDDQIVPYDPKDIEKYSYVPQETKDYFKQEFENGENGIKLFFRYIPHILYKGEINISNAEIVTFDWAAERGIKKGLGRVTQSLSFATSYMLCNVDYSRTVKEADRNALSWSWSGMAPAFSALNE